MRLGAYCRTHFADQRYQLISEIELETGVRVPWIGTTQSLDHFFQNAELRDVLDAITHIYRRLVKNARIADAREWLTYVARVLGEEHTTYSVGTNGVVSFAVDEAYASVRKATLLNLQDERWREARAEFERAFSAMDRDPADTNGAIRAIAAAVESSAKVILSNSVARVGPAEIERELWPLVQSRYVSDAAALNASHLLLKAYADWVSCTHQYRHGQGSVDEGHAPFELAVTTLTVGSGILRWLVGLGL